MNNDNLNPFGITKASDFTDEQIADFWVNVWGGRKRPFLNPREPMPKYILGSKGCGKTHLMRYYSFSLQKIRYNNNVKALIKKDKYIGIFSLFGSLDSTRFTEKGINDDVWKSIFEYYMELINTQILIKIMIEIFVSLKVDFETEKKVCIEILKNFIFDEKIKYIENLNSLNIYLNSIQVCIDNEVNNCAVTRTLNSENIKIRFTRGNLLFGIPEIISENIPELKKVRFLYLMDELERLTEIQKKYINTLVWEKKQPSTFWIGARTYGFKEKGTYSNEDLKEGSEYEILHLDSFLREQEKHYKKFVKSLFIKRLQNYNYWPNVRTNKMITEEDEHKIHGYFEKFSEGEVLKKISLKYKDKDFPHTNSLRKKLIDSYEKNLLYGVRTMKEIENIISCLKVKQNPLHEKINYFLLYQDWAKKKNLIKSAANIKHEYQKYLKGEKKVRHLRVINKFRRDLLAQLLEEVKEKNYNTGLETLIEMSWGNPRYFLTILKHTFKWSIFYNENPFTDSCIISQNSQVNGINEAAKWFYEDSEIKGKQGIHLYNSISNLGDLFRGVRFSDKPNESSPCSFYVNLASLSIESFKMIELATDHSFLVKIFSGRKGKNFSNILSLYQINRMLSPRWNLPISRRGTLKIPLNLLESIFNNEVEFTFDANFKNYIDLMNAPFLNRSKTNILYHQQTLPGL